MAVRHDAPKELDPRAIAWTVLAAGKPVGIQMLTSQLNNWLSEVHNANRFRAKRGDYSFELPEDQHGHYLPNDGERNLIMSADGKLQLIGINRELNGDQQVLAHMIVHGDRTVGYDIRIKGGDRAIRIHTKNGIRRNRKYTVKPTQGQVKSLLTELLGGESSWLQHRQIRVQASS